MVLAGGAKEPKLMTSQQSEHRIVLSVLALIAAMLSLGIGASLAKTLFDTVGPLGTAAYRILVGATILIVIFRPWRWRTKMAQWRQIAPYGLTLGLMNLFFYQALSTLPVGVAIAIEAIAIEFAGPLLLATLTSRKPIDFLWVALAAAGLLLLSPLNQLNEDLDPAGVVFALAAGGCWAAYIVLGRRASRLPAGQVTSLGMLLAAALAMPFGVAQAGLSFLDPSLVVVGVLVGLLSSAIPYTLEMFALKHLQTKTFGVVLSIEPAFGALAAAMVLGEFLQAIQLGAILCIMAASAGCTLTAVRRNNP